MTASHPYLSHPKYRPDIDGLRAIAVLSVVVFHAFPGWMKGGFIGVDVFFVISGFLISTIIFESLDKGTFSFTEFYARRIRRIFPALILVLVACFTFGWFALLADEYKQLGKHIAAGAGFVSNLLLWSEAGYFDNSAETKPLLHLWSLGIEEQFYIVWPFVLWLAWKRRFNLLTLTILVAIASFYLNLKGIKKDTVATFYSPQTRFWELLCGSLLAWLTLYKKSAFTNIKNSIEVMLTCVVYKNKQEGDGKTVINVLSLIGLLLLLYGFWRINKQVNFPGKWALVPVIGAVFIITAGATAWVNRTILSNKIVVWFGVISFPLYLWHWPILSFARIIEEEVPSLTIRMAAVVFSVVLAWLTYKLVERPVRLGKHGKGWVMVLFAIMAVIGYVGYDVHKKKGFAFRFNSSLNKIISAPLPDVVDFDCATKIPELSGVKFKLGCKLSKDKEPTILFVGDSHTYHYKNAVWKSFPDDSVLMVAEPSCLPFSNDQLLSGECRQKYSSIIRYLESNKSIKKVVLSGYWSYLISGGFRESGENWRIAKEPTKENIDSFILNSSEFISRTLKSGKSIVLMKDIPDLNFNIKMCFDNRPIRLTPFKIKKDCSINENEFISRISSYDDVIEQILQKFPSVLTFNPRRLLCKDYRCLASDGSLPYYWNGDHVNHHGAKIVIEGLIDELFMKK